MQRGRRLVVSSLLLVAAFVVPGWRPASAAVAGTPLATFDLQIDALDLVYDAVHDVVWASMGGQGQYGENGVVPIERDGTVGTPIPVGLRPNRLAVSDDGAFLYVGLDGEHAVRQVDLETRTAGMKWPLVTTSLTPVFAADIAVMPGQPEVVAVSQGKGGSPSTAGVVIYDAGAPRPDVTPSHTGPDEIAASATLPDGLYGINTQSTGFQTYRIEVTPTGATVVDTRSGLLSTWARLFSDGDLLSDGSHLVDGATMTLLGTLPVTVSWLVLDAGAQRGFGIVEDVFQVFDTTTFLTLDTFELLGWDDSPDFTLPVMTRFADGPFVALLETRVMWFDPTTLRGAAGEYTALTPFRVLDTRTGVGAAGMVAPVGPGATREVQVAGVGGVPAAGVDSVVLNATAAAATELSYLTVWPSGGPMPDSSNLNFAAGETRANLLTVPLGAGGRVSLFNERGNAHVIFDVVGFYATPDGPVGSRFRAQSPQRLFDTRGGAPVGPGGVFRFDVTGVGGVPDAGVTAVAVNVTAVNATASSYVTVWPDDAPQPNASSINLPAGGTVPNLVIVRVPASGVIDFFNEAGDVHLLADVVGYYTSDRSSEGGRFVSFWPFRFMDTRVESPFDPPGDLWPGDTIYLDGEGEVYGAYVLNVTVTGTQGAGYVTVHPWPGEPPNASNLNYTDNVSVPNAVIVRTGPGMAFSNFGGFTHLIADVFGAFTSA